MRWRIGTTVWLLGVTTVLAAPATQPAEADPHRVLIEPFQPVDPAEASAPLARGLSAHLQSAMARIAYLPLIGSDLCDDPNAARAAGRAAKAAIVIYGTYQQVGTRVRFDGGVVNVDTGAIVTGLTATGDVAAPFDCQDRIVAQTLAGLKAPAAGTNDSPAAPDATTALSVPHLDAPKQQPAYAPLVAMLDRNRSQSNDNLAHIQRSSDRQTYYPGAFGYGGYYGYSGIGGFGGAAGFGGFFGPGVVIGGRSYNAGYAPYANGRVGYGIGAGAPP